MNDRAEYREKIRLILRERIGLDESSLGSAAIDRSIERAMEAASVDSVRAYWQRLNRSAAALDALVEEVVVPETWFFREPATFTMLERVVARAWLDMEHDRPMQVLSIPCSTGEEPYSIAIKLTETFGDCAWFNVDAVDISSRALRIAAAGEYGASAFRGQSEALRLRYFDKTKCGYRVIPAIRERVNFQEGNLLRLDSSATEARYDCIFCRNLLIYLDPELKPRIVRNLSRMLQAKGVLIATAAESGWLKSGPFELLPGTQSAFRKRKGTRVAAKSESQPIERNGTRRADGAPKPAAPSLGHSEPARKARTGQSLEHARALADSGNLREAAEECRHFLTIEVASVDGHYLLGLLHDAMNETEEAIAWYRRALYINPAHQDSLEHLTLLHEKSGALQAARQSRTRLSRLVRTPG